ncbi:DUF4252 domain-containing protein [Alistipes sp.]|uniref:DUF4252 domain-containing protein n=1 Tax=Alistipes sp. TaxID=1872444 RepID=UPI003AF1BB2B
MKRILLILILALPHTLLAQSKAVERFFDSYLASESVTSVQLEPKMMQLMSRQAAERGDEELAQLLRDIRFIRIVALKGGDRERFVDDARRAVTAGGFPLVTSSTEQGQTTLFYLREARLTDNAELLMLTYGPKETVVVDIYGAFDLQEVVRLSAIRPQ